MPLKSINHLVQYSESIEHKVLTSFWIFVNAMQLQNYLDICHLKKKLFFLFIFFDSIDKIV